MKHEVLGFLRPTVGNTVVLTTRFSGCDPINVSTFRRTFPSSQSMSLASLYSGKVEKLQTFCVLVVNSVKVYKECLYTDGVD